MIQSFVGGHRALQGIPWWVSDDCGRMLSKAVVAQRLQGITGWFPSFFFLNDGAPTEISPFPLHAPLPISGGTSARPAARTLACARQWARDRAGKGGKRLPKSLQQACNMPATCFQLWTYSGVATEARARASGRDTT